MAHSASLAPSPWVQRFAAGLPAGEVLDLACGGGRHSRLLAAQGHAVLAVDRDAAALEMLANAGLAGLEVLQADLENHPEAWPQELFARGRYAGIVVTNYLFRPLFPLLFASLAAGGLLIYETFAVGNERYGKPSNPAFLLSAGELLGHALAPEMAGLGLRVLAFEEGRVDVPDTAVVQRICVRRMTDASADVRLPA